MPAAHKCAPASAFLNDTARGQASRQSNKEGRGEKRAAQNVSGVPFAVVIAFLIAYLYPVLRTVQMSFFEVSDISAARDTLGIRRAL